ncbi:ChbG/HpnK family deacetylase [Pontibacter liquoris]|uniref:ChbG/HpnK family deacetylase n=1 Tax=Pontibacter liquoris TaxID=2905677 RepID=UPI00346202D8
MLRSLPLLFILLFAGCMLAGPEASAQKKKTNTRTAVPQEQTYAEKLGWKKGDRVVILHIDDAGMSYDSNLGAIRALEEGVASSVSVMMTCPWVPGFVHYLQQHPTVDAGLHLTLTSEWRDYRWGRWWASPPLPAW